MEELEERGEIDLIHDWLGLEGDKTRYVQPTYEQKRDYLTSNVGLDGTTIVGEDLLTVVSLINAFVLSARKKNPLAGPREIVKAILGEPTGKNDTFVRERVCLMCEMFLTYGSKFRTFGLDSKESVIAEVKRIFDSWIPF